MSEAQTNLMHFELVSPESKLISEPAFMVVIPGMEGELGVLAGHASFVVGLKPGLIKMYTAEGEEPRCMFVAGGFADVTAENCTVLAEAAINVKDMDRGEIEQTLEDLKEDLSLAEEDDDKKRIEDKIAFANAQLRAVLA